MGAPVGADAVRISWYVDRSADVVLINGWKSIDYNYSSAHQHISSAAADRSTFPLYSTKNFSKRHICCSLRHLCSSKKGPASTFVPDSPASKIYILTIRKRPGYPINSLTLIKTNQSKPTNQNQ
jgi:hypothetical protein